MMLFVQLEIVIATNENFLSGKSLVFCFLFSNPLLKNKAKDDGIFDIAVGRNALKGMKSFKMFHKNKVKKFSP